MFGIRIEFFEKLRNGKKQVDKHGINHEFCNGKNGFILNFKFRGFSKYLKEEYEYGRAGTESRCQEPGGKQSTIPIWACR